MTRTLTCLFCIASLFLSLKSFGQGIGLNSTGVAPNPLSIVDMTSTTQGFLIPRMSKSQRQAIAGPASGLLVYQNDTEKGFYHFDGLLWQPWLKPRAGAVTMGLAVSTITKGTGYSVTHIQEGRDQVIYTDPYVGIPDITLSAEALPGTAPSAPFDYCFTSLTNCADVNIRFIRLKTGIGVNPDASVFMETGVTGCNPASNNYTSYNLSQTNYTAQPNNINATPLNAGSSFYVYAVRSTTASASNVNAFSLWFDWDQNGSFDDVTDNNFGGTERILSESLATTTNSPGANINNVVNFSVVIPSAAQVCNGVITARLMVRDVINNQIPCDEPGVKGETEDFEIKVTNGTDCAPFYTPKSVNCNIINSTVSGFFVNCVDRYGDPINGIYNFKVVQ
jgi:hypothetical protein